MSRPVIAIAGPTASGKTGLAVRVAKAVGGEVVNADALQVYSGIPVLSAQPGEAERDGMPHHLFGKVAPAAPWSVGHWLRAVDPLIIEVLARGRAPVLVGGTGLYFKALLQGLADIPPVPDDLSAALDRLPVEDLREQAESLDPEAASRVLGDDPQRLARIVGVALGTERVLSEWRAGTKPLVPPRFVRRAVLLPDRAMLYDRINARFDAMMEAGALDEARAVAALDVSERAPMTKAIGLSHLLAHLRGELSLGEAVETAKRDSRRLAKRQMTWFRNQCADWEVLRDASEIDAWVASL